MILAKMLRLKKFVARIFCINIGCGLCIWILVMFVKSMAIKAECSCLYTNKIISVGNSDL